MAKKIQDGNQIVTNVDSNDNLTFSIKDSFIDSTPTVNSTNLVTSGGVKSALDINTTDIAAAVIRIANNETNISNNTNDIEALEDAVSTNTTNISTNTTDINNLETTVGNLSTNVNTNTTNIGTLSNLTTTDKTSVVNALNELNSPEKWVSVGTEAPTDGKRVWFKKGKNLFNKNNIETGKYYVTTGISASTNWAISQIPVKPSTNYYLTGNNYNNTNAYIVLLDSDKNILSSVGSYPNVHSITTTSTTSYIGLSIAIYSGSSDLDTIQLEEGSTATTYEPYVEQGIYVDEEEWYSKPKVLWSGKATSVDVDLRGYSFIEVIFCSNDNFYNSLKVPVSGSTFSRTLALCNNYLSDPMESSGHLYLKYGKATLTQSGIKIKTNVEVDITNTTSQIRWQGATNTLLYITNIIGYK